MLGHARRRFKNPSPKTPDSRRRSCKPCAAQTRGEGNRVGHRRAAAAAIIGAGIGAVYLVAHLGLAGFRLRLHDIDDSRLADIRGCRARVAFVSRARGERAGGFGLRHKIPEKVRRGYSAASEMGAGGWRQGARPAQLLASINWAQRA